MNALCPGYVETALIGRMPKPMIAKALFAQTPARAVARLQDIANAALFLYAFGYPAAGKYNGTKLTLCSVPAPWASTPGTATRPTSSPAT